MNTPVSLFLLRKKHRKKEKRMANPNSRIAITSFAMLDTPSD
jgi:hypothetical protein